MSELVGLEVAEGLATLTLSRPEAGNAMNWDFIAALDRATETIAADAGVRAVLIAAQGRNFCVGGDIGAFAAQADPSAFIRRLADLLHKSVARLAELPAPVVVAVQGAAAGAGLSLAAGGDIVLAANSASFTMAYTGIGLSSDGGATWVLPRLIGLRLTQELAFTNRRLSADEAQACGLVTRVVEAEDLLPQAHDLASRLARGPTQAFAAVKRLLQSSGQAPLRTQLDAEAHAIGRAMASADAKEGVAAFLERRKPVFRG